MIAAVAFDLDGTLVDSRADIVAAVTAAFEARSLRPPAPDAVARAVGDGARALLRALLGPEAPEAQLEALLTEFSAYYAAHAADHTTPRAHAGDALDALGHLPLAVCTNKPRAAAVAVLSALGLRERFRAVVAGGDLPWLKPDPRVLRELAARLDVPVEALALVGDGVQDIACGRAAGSPTVAVLGGFGDEDALRAAGPDRIVPSLAELPRALVALGAPPAPRVSG